MLDFLNENKTSRKQGDSFSKENIMSRKQGDACFLNENIILKKNNIVRGLHFLGTPYK